MARYPTDSEIEDYSRDARVLELHSWIWRAAYVDLEDCQDAAYANCEEHATPLWYDRSWIPGDGRWHPADEAELRRVVDTAHRFGMLVVPYFSGEKHSPDAIVAEARPLKLEYAVDGLYLDGMVPIDASVAEKHRGAVALRQLFGDEGWLNLHDTHGEFDSPFLGFAPFVHAHMDFITSGEHVVFDRWGFTTFGISNASGGHWPEIPAFFPEPPLNLPAARDFLKTLIERSLPLDNRVLWLAGEQGQWRYWRLQFTAEETAFFREYYLARMRE